VPHPGVSLPLSPLPQSPPPDPASTPAQHRETVGISTAAVGAAWEARELGQQVKEREVKYAKLEREHQKGLQKRE
jgi:hypothetical protein